MGNISILNVSSATMEQFVTQAITRPLVSYLSNPVIVWTVTKFGAVAFPTPLAIANAVGSLAVAAFNTYNNASRTTTTWTELLEFGAVVVLTGALYKLAAGASLGICSLLVGTITAVVLSIFFHLIGEAVFEEVKE